MGSHRLLRGSWLKRCASFRARSMPQPPACKRRTLTEGVNGRRRMARKPRGRLQRQSRGSSRRLAIGPTSEIRLKALRSRGAVPMVAAVETIRAARIQRPTRLPGGGLWSSGRLIRRTLLSQGTMAAMAATAAKESWKEMVKRLSGRQIRMIRAARARVVNSDFRC